MPCGNLASFLVVEELVDTAAAQVGGSCDLADRESCVMSYDDCPDTLLLGLNQRCGGEMEPRVQLLCTTDAFSEDLANFHALEDTRLSSICPGNWTGGSDSV
jgi:hypothetical protein